MALDMIAMTNLHRNLTFALLAAVFGLSVIGCEKIRSSGGNGSMPPDTMVPAGTLHLTGSSTMTPLMSEITQRFHALHPQVLFIIETGGSSRGISDVRSGNADIGMASRVLNAEEKGVTGFPVARDGVGIMVHKDNPVKTLSQSEVVAIFTGQSQNWKAFNGQDIPITVIARDKLRGLTGVFLDHYKLRYEDIKAQKVVGDNIFAFDAVRGNVAAVTLISVVAADEASGAGIPVKLIPLDGIVANNRSILTGNYSLTRPLTLVTTEAPTLLVQRFIEFTLSSQVTDLIQKLGFIPYLE